MALIVLINCTFSNLAKKKIKKMGPFQYQQLIKRITPVHKGNGNPGDLFTCKCLLYASRTDAFTLWRAGEKA